MFSRKDTLYLAGYTLSTARDMERMLQLLEEHPNAAFKVIDNGNILSEDFHHERAFQVSKRGSGAGESATKFVVREPLVLDKQDTDHECVWNKCAEAPIGTLRLISVLCGRYGFVNICLVSYYNSIWVNDTQEQVVFRGRDYETYKGLQV